MQLPEVLAKYPDLVSQMNNEVVRNGGNHCKSCKKNSLLRKYTNLARERDKALGKSPS